VCPAVTADGQHYRLLHPPRGLPHRPARESHPGFSLLLRRAPHLPHQKLHHAQGPAQAHSRPAPLQASVPRPVCAPLPAQNAQPQGGDLQQVHSQGQPVRVRGGGAEEQRRPLQHTQLGDY